jgi:antitoxin CptB
MFPVEAAEMNRLRWRCRRGMRELDMIFDLFLIEDYPALDPTRRQAFVRLLEVNDPELYDWVLGRTVPTADDFFELVERLKAHRPQR